MNTSWIQRFLPAWRDVVVLRFALAATIGTMVLMVGWTKVSPWLSYPVAALTEVVLKQAAPTWTGDVRRQVGSIAVDFAMEVVRPNTGGQRARPTFNANPGRYAYGLPIFWALLLAAWVTHRAPGRWRRVALGYLLLLPFQTFSLVMLFLTGMMRAAGFDARMLAVAPWQMDALAYGFQLGVLVLPTLAPVLVWLLLDRQFFNEVIVPGWKRRR